MFSAKVHRRIYFVLLTLLGGCMVTSIGMSNVMWVLLLANWLLEGRWSEKWTMARQSRLLHAVAFFFLLHAVGLLWTSNLPAGFHVVERLLPWLAVPLVVLTTRPPAGRARSTILTLYMGTVFVVTVIGLVRHLAIPDLPYRQMVPFISHIRFALNCCMVVFFCVNMLRHADGGTPLWRKVALVALMVWMMGFLLLLRSYTAFVVFGVVSLVVVLGLRRRWLWLAVWLAVVGGTAAYVVVQYRAYHTLQPIALQPVALYTPSGNPYLHLHDGMVESGNYVNNYLCHEELAQQWPKRSRVPLDSLTASGYNVEASLVRYLNALGLPKDSVGLAALSDEQVAEVARGVPNPVYEHAPLPQRMLHVMFFELENYRCYRAVEGFSMLQRLELWRTALHIIGRHPWTGVGTGDLGEAMEAEFRRSASPLQGSDLMPHNEYLTLIAMFGLPLFVLMVLVWLRAAPRLRRQGQLFVALTVAVLVSFLAENTLDSLAGILFCTWFMAFRRPESNPESTGVELC